MRDQIFGRQFLLTCLTFIVPVALMALGFYNIPLEKGVTTMKEYLRAPFVVPGLILTAAGILASLLIRFIDSNLLSIAGLHRLRPAVFFRDLPHLKLYQHPPETMISSG